MRRGTTGWTRRLAAVVGVSVVTMLVTGPGASAVSVKDLTSYSAFGTGQVLRVKLTLPKAVTETVNTVLGAVQGLTGPLQLPETIDEAIVFTRSVGQHTGAVNGTGLGQIFKGVSDNTLDNSLNSVAQKLFGKVLPVAQAVLGKDLGEVTDSLQSLDLPSQALKLIHVGVMEVSAQSIPHAGIPNAAFSKASSRLLGITIDLGQQIKDLLINTLQPVLSLTDGQGGLIDTLNGTLNTLKGTLSTLPAVGDIVSNLNLTLPKIADLLSKPLLKIGLIETGSSTDATGVARLASGVSKVADISVFGNDASDSLVYVKSLESRASAKIDGTAGGAAAAAEHTIVGLSVLNNNIAVTDKAIQIAGQTIDLPLDLVNQLTDLLGSALGLEVKVLETKTVKSALHSSAEANTLRISLHPTVAGLGELLGLDIWTPSASADVAGDIVGASQPGRPSPTTGIPDTAFLLAGPALLGMAVLVRKFALSN